MAPEIRTIKTVDGFRLRVTFKNGEVRFFDMRRFLDKGIFQELKNPRYFKKVRVITGGIEWPHEQDLSADTLYYQGTSKLAGNIPLV